MSKPSQMNPEDPVESLCNALGYRDSLERLRRRKRPFYDRICQLLEQPVVMSTLMTSQTPANKIMLIGEKGEVTPLMHSPKAHFLARSPDWNTLLKKCPSSLDTLEKKVYWCFKNGKLSIRKDHLNVAHDFRSPPTMVSCIIVDDESKEAFYASDYYMESISKAIGPFVNMKRQVKRQDSTFSVSVIKNELVGHMDELSELYGTPKAKKPVVEKKDKKKVKKLKKASKPVTREEDKSDTTLHPKPDIVLLYEKLLKMQY